MINYALEWKKKLNLQQVSYEEFVTEYPTASGIFIEKIDSMLGLLIYDRHSLKFQSTTGHYFYELPVLNEYKTFFEKNDIKQALIPGEMVAVKNNTILPFNDAQSIIKKSYLEQNKPLVYHYPYDIVSINDNSYDFKKASAFIQKNFKNMSEHIRTLKTIQGGIDDFRLLYSLVSNQTGFDGVVAREINGKNYKVKFTGTVDLVVTGGGKEGLPAWKKGQVSYLTTAFLDRNGLYRTSSKIGTGFTQEKRIYFYNYLNENALYKKDGEICVKPKLVIEVKFFRYRITPTTLLTFEGNKYEHKGMHKSITFSHPSFERLRLDKEVNKYDVRLEQIPEWEY
jgi:ATP-dependent DNA ligase